MTNIYKYSMDDYMKKFREVEKELYTQQKDDEQCQHANYLITDTHIVCSDCGCVLRYEFIDGFDIHLRTKNKKTEYKRTRNLSDLMEKFNGKHIIDNLNLEEYPTDIRGIRQILRQKKLKPHFDIGIWKAKNNINIRFRREYMMILMTEYSKNRKKSAKDFLYEKVNDHTEYNIFASILKRKIIKKVNRTV
jgi:transcription initiation factor TFIIIB Brf1 subunit/transcription initiation factor TFIIB